MKIKKYTIDQEIPKNIKASNLLRTVLHTGSGLVEFYFLVEEENVPRMRETNTIKCPKCSHTIIIY